MISPIAQSLNAAYGVRELPGQIKIPGQASGGLPKVGDVEKPGGLGLISPTTHPASTSFTDMIGTLVQEVDGKSKAADSEVRNLMLGQTDNLHQSMKMIRHYNPGIDPDFWTNFGRSHPFLSYNFTINIELHLIVNNFTKQTLSLMSAEGEKI